MHGIRWLSSVPSPFQYTLVPISRRMPLNVRQPCGLETNPSHTMGYAMWLALMEAGSLEHAAARLMNELDDTAGQLQQDLQDLLGKQEQIT